jgi:hypothetical protein
MSRPDGSTHKWNCRPSNDVSSAPEQPNQPSGCAANRVGTSRPGVDVQPDRVVS